MSDSTPPSALCGCSTPYFDLPGHHLLFSKHMRWVVRKHCDAEVYFQHRFEYRVSCALFSLFSFSYCSLFALRCPSLRVLSRLGSQIVCRSFPSTLFLCTNIKPYFHASPGLIVLEHKATNMTYAFQTFISYCTLEFQSKEYLLGLRFPLNFLSPGIERCSVAFYNVSNV